MKVLIAGGGKTLYFLCRSFAAKGYEVVVVNRDRGECGQLARELRATVVCGDGSDASVLADAGARSADVVLAITPNDQDNLVICQLASLLYDVPRTVALANDPDNAEVFQRLGVTSFSTTQVVGNMIQQRAALEQITNLLPVGEGRVLVTELVLDSSSPVVGRRLADATLPVDALVAVVIRGSEAIVPKGGSILEDGDRVVLVTLPEHHGDALRTLTGERG
ncbi:MAG: TrkA family potassium uptake protein [Thermoanaerobaculales bacterium]|jgi:trk system potassium uptake protein TrkA|nr:TrkA family potassium uptake protein [Thermoanaerobaculales bacterium]